MSLSRLKTATDRHLEQVAIVLFAMRCVCVDFICWVLLPPWLSASWLRHQLCGVSSDHSCVSGHESTVWPVVCHWLQSQSSDAARPHLCKLARHGPWSVWKQFCSVRDWRGWFKPGCWMEGNLALTCLANHGHCWMIVRLIEGDAYHEF